ncbi:cell wall integrity and stress response component 1, partial [Tetranychus urticae]|uniref:cell wall integrity and stress response component 1 n=1 Tax=Tetranychus urticae TaxID=32264 RepID=UPI000D651616
MVSLVNHLIKLDRLILHCFHWILTNMVIQTCVLFLLLCIVTTNGNNHDGPSPFDHETLSPRSVNTKYGALRGFVIYFKNIDRSGFPGSRPFPSSSPSSPGSPATSGSSSSSNQSSSSPTTPTTSSSTSSSSSSYSSTSSTSSTFTSSKSNLASMTPVEVFLGVPYATPPIGSLRFMPPVTPTHWRGVKLSNRLGPVCPQKLPDITLKQCKCNDGENKGHRSNANNSNNVNSNNS